MIALHKRFSIACLLTLLAVPFAMANSGEGENSSEDDPTPQTLYVNMEPAFVTQVGEPGSKLSYLKANVTLRVDSKAAEKAVDEHMPRLRHELVMLFSAQTDAEQLSSGTGQELLRHEALARLNTALESQHREERIDDVLFTTFVIQR